MPSQIATSPLTLVWFWSNPRVGLDAKLAFELVCESGTVPFSDGNVPVVLVGVARTPKLACRRFFEYVSLPKACVPVVLRLSGPGSVPLENRSCSSG